MDALQYSVKTEVFEGPLDLLLSLIEKRKLLINDISLSKVTDDFIEHDGRLEQFPLADSARFILIASILLFIKSKSLLPSLDLTDEEEGSIQDLENRLKIYKRIKELAEHVKEIFGKDIIFAVSSQKQINPVFSPDESITAQSLHGAICDVLRNIPKKETTPKAIVRKVVSLEEMIDNLTTRIKTSLRMNFKEFAKVGKTEKVNVIVSFLAMLELVKQGIIHANQENRFDEIQMETREVATPRYV